MFSVACHSVTVVTWLGGVSASLAVTLTSGAAVAGFVFFAALRAAAAKPYGFRQNRSFRLVDDAQPTLRRLSGVHRIVVHYLDCLVLLEGDEFGVATVDPTALGTLAMGARGQ